MPEPLDIVALRKAVGDRWARVGLVDQTESTNADLMGEPGAPDGAVLIAEHQVSGRGRLGRSWVSPPRRGLTFSVLVRPTVEMARWAWLPLLAGTALSEAVCDYAGVRGGLKWPNDLLLTEPDGVPRKAAGILTQSAGDRAVIGIGMNVLTTRAELPVETATSLTLAAGRDIDRAELLARVLTALRGHYDRWLVAGGDAERSGLAAAYLAVSDTVGRQVRVARTDGSTLAGTALGIDRYGQLQVQTLEGVASVGAGDVEHVRPA